MTTCREKRSSLTGRSRKRRRLGWCVGISVCPVANSLIRNVAARARKAMFVLRVDRPVDGIVEVRNGPFPFFLGASRKEFPLVDGLEVHRKFFDASFELVVTASAEVEVTIE